MADSSITKREAIGGGVIAALLTAAIPLVQLWAEGQRRDAGDKASGDEIQFFAPIIRQQFDYSRQLEAKISELERDLWRCQNRSD